MAKYLRVIRADRWQISKNRTDADLANNALRDLRPDENGNVSFYRVDDDELNREAILVAIAASRDYISPMEYVCVPSSEIDELGYPVLNTAGETLDVAVNEVHVDVHLQDSDALIRLARLLLSSQDRGVQLKRELLESIAIAIRESRFQLNELKPKAQEQVRPILSR